MQLICSFGMHGRPFFLSPLSSTPQAVGRTRHNKLLYFPGDGPKLKGKLVDVHVDRVHAYTLYGKMLD